MARYHFTTEDGSVDPDKEGTVLPDLAEAKREAVLFVSGLLKDAPEQLFHDHFLKVTARDDSGLTLFQVEVCITEAPAMKQTK